MSLCRVCASALPLPFAAADLLDRRVKYFECGRCGYVQTEYPSWLEEAYAVPINPCDTGILVRNQQNVSSVLATLRLLGAVGGKVVDYAGGYGILVRLLRDQGIDAYWKDAFTENLLAQGFEHRGQEDCVLATAFEALEHFVDPPQELAQLFELAPNLLLTTDLIPRPAPAPGAWDYYGLNHGQHIGFFRKETLQYLADRFGRYLLTDGQSLHLLSEKPHSPFHWWLLRRIGRTFPSALALGLASKTWPDHQAATYRSFAAFGKGARLSEKEDES